MHARTNIYSSPLLTPFTHPLARAEWMFYDPNGAPIPILNAYSGSPPQSATAIHDGDSNTNWVGNLFDSGSTVTFELPYGSDPNSYEFITAPNDPNRDPTGWTMDINVWGGGVGGGAGGGGYGGREPLPSVSNFVPPGDRETPTGRFTLGTLFEVDFSSVVGSPQTDDIQIAGERAARTDLSRHLIVISPITPFTHPPARAEWMFYGPSGALIPIIQAHGGSPPQSAAAIHDGDSNTNWVGSINSGSTVTFELPRGSDPASYEYITAPNDPNHDPSGWTMNQLVNGGSEPLPSVSSFVPPADRETPTGTFSLGMGISYEVSFDSVVGGQTGNIQIAGKSVHA